MSTRDKHKPECVEYGRDWPEKEAAPCICRRVGKVGCITCGVYRHPSNGQCLRRRISVPGVQVGTMSRATAREQYIQMELWSKALMKMLGEMEIANGEPPQGSNSPKLEHLVRFAYEEAAEQAVRLKGVFNEVGMVPYDR